LRQKYAIAASDNEPPRDLGACYYKGQGVVQDNEKAVEWYQKAAEQGNEYAIHTLAFSAK